MNLKTCKETQRQTYKQKYKDQLTSNKKNAFEIKLEVLAPSSRTYRNQKHQQRQKNKDILQVKRENKDNKMLKIKSDCKIELKYFATIEL